MTILPERCTLILAPETPFDAIAWELSRAGWRPESPDAPVAMDEPDHASWAHEGTIATYTFHPGIFLRLLSIEGPRALELRDDIAGRLPVLGERDARELMASEEVEERVLGIYVAGALKAIGLFAEVSLLLDSQDRLVAQAAQTVVTRLTGAALDIVEHRQTAGDRSLLFHLIADARQRRQVLRWVIQVRKEPGEAVLAVLRSGLTDRDGEVRLTAMLAAVRLGAAAVAPLIHKLTLPGSAEGFDSADRRLLAALQHLSLELLSGRTPPDEPASPPATRELMQDHLMRCILGMPVAHYDAAFLLIAALTEPVPIIEPPFHVPPGLGAGGEGWHTFNSGLPMVWVPPIPHWVGTAMQTQVPNPIRRVTPKGFFIARKPHRTCTFPEALDLCRSLGELDDVMVTLPTAEEWEMAARGPDGRRYPWGNGIERDRSLESPWGMEDAVGTIEEWTLDALAPDRRIVCGGKSKAPELRHVCAPETPGVGLRVIIRVSG